MWRVLQIWAVCAAISVFAGVSPALADPPEGELNASVGALASGLIGDSNAEGVFEVYPAQHDVAVRHSRSGLICRLDPGFRNRLLIFPQAARGEDVACDSTDGTESITLYATRFSFDVTPQELIEGASAAIHQRFPDARELPMPAGASDASLPASSSAQFMVTRDGAPTYTRVTVAIVGEWAIKLRYSIVAPNEVAVRQGEAAADALFSQTLNDLGYGAPPPVATQPVSGTGFFITADGYLVTNHHVVEGRQVFHVILGNESLPATLISVDAANDLAILHIDAVTTPLVLGSAEDVRAGQEVFAMGFPLAELNGGELRANFGRVNALSGVGGDPRFLQIDVPIQPGNSGGPLVGPGGNVVGVVTARLNDLAVLAATGSLPENVGYAIKIDYLLPLLPRGAVLSQNALQGSLENRVERGRAAVVLVLSE